MVIAEIGGVTPPILILEELTQGSAQNVLNVAASWDTFVSALSIDMVVSFYFTCRIAFWVLSQFHLPIGVVLRTSLNGFKDTF